MIELHDLTESSGDSFLQEYAYTAGLLILDLNISELKKKIKVKIETDTISFNRYYLQKTDELYRTCRINIEGLVEALSMQNGIYVPPTEFRILMQQSRANYHLAYGKRSSEVKYIFSLLGSEPIISCLLPHLNSISIEG